MTRQFFFRLFLLSAYLLLICVTCNACSTYKVTVDGMTRYGMNYDTWFVNPKIWFETKGYGAAFTGANYQGGNDLTPQSGMNEFGLSFGTLATPTPENGKPSPEKKQITSRSEYLKSILHSCRNVDEVKLFVEKYDHSSLSKDVFIYTEPSGKYLIVEPYELIVGNENKYVLANFCPSTITDFSTIKQQRYINGTAFLKNNVDTSMDFCKALSDTMHVCREKIGDGTLLTSIWDLNKGNVNLYFYHDYSHRVQFNIRDELAKGDHFYEVASLFPLNAEYQKLIDFKTPVNSSAIHWTLLICLCLFAFSFPYFLVGYIRNRKARYAGYKLLLAVLSAFMSYYMVKLLTVMAIYYFPSPYKGYQFSLLDIASYLPFAIALLIIPVLFINKKVWKEITWKNASKFLLSLNSLAYVLMIVLFSYWRFYNIF